MISILSSGGILVELVGDSLHGVRTALPTTPATVLFVDAETTGGATAGVIRWLRRVAPRAQDVGFASTTSPRHRQELRQAGAFEVLSFSSGADRILAVAMAASSTKTEVSASAFDGVAAAAGLALLAAGVLAIVVHRVARAPLQREHMSRR